MNIHRMTLGHAPCVVGRVSYTGDLGYEIWMGHECQGYIYDLLHEAGADLGLRDFGLRALNTLRLKKGLGGWARGYRTVQSPWECGLGRFVALDRAVRLHR